MSRWPDDPTSYRPSARWLGVVVVVVMLGIFAVIGAFMWMSARHSSLVSQLGGAWTASSPGSESRLQISGGAGDLVVEGSIAGRQVSGGIDVPRTWWGSLGDLSINDGSWIMRYDDSGRTLLVTGVDGTVMTFTRAP
jgi:hypothetical protein